MGKKGSWIHSIKKALRSHLVGDIDPHKFQHLHTPSEGIRTRAYSDNREYSTGSSHTVNEHYDEPRQSCSSSQVVGGSGHHDHEENRRSSTSSQMLGGGSGSHKKSPKHDKEGNRSDISSWEASGGTGGRQFDEKSLNDNSPPSSSRAVRRSVHHSYNDENGSEYHGPELLYRGEERRTGERGTGDHRHLVKLDRKESAGGSTSHNPFYDRSNKEEKGRSSTTLEKRNRAAEELLAATEKDNLRYSTAGGGNIEEKRRPSTSSQKERSAHEKPSLENGRLSNVSSTHKERTVLEKARVSTSSNHNVKTTSSSENRRPSTPSSPDDRAKFLLSETLKLPPENRRPSTDRGRPKPPSSPRKVMDKIHLDTSRSTTGPVTPQPDRLQQRAAPPPGLYAPLGRSIALQDLLKPPSFERKSSSSSTVSVCQVGGSARSITSEGSDCSEDFLELVFPLPNATRTSVQTPPPAVANQRKKVAIATIQEVFSLQEYEAPVSPGSQRRKSGNFNSKTLVPLAEHGTKPLLPPDYRKQQPAAAVANLGTVMFHAGDAGVGGMLGEWAAVMIQSSWRGYSTRQAFKALCS